VKSTRGNGDSKQTGIQSIMRSSRGLKNSKKTKGIFRISTTWCASTEEKKQREDDEKFLKKKGKKDPASNGKPSEKRKRT